MLKCCRHLIYVSRENATHSNNKYRPKAHGDGENYSNSKTHIRCQNCQPLDISFVDIVSAFCSTLSALGEKLHIVNTMLNHLIVEYTQRAFCSLDGKFASGFIPPMVADARALDQGDIKLIHFKGILIIIWDFGDFNRNYCQSVLSFLSPKIHIQHKEMSI